MSFPKLFIPNKDQPAPVAQPKYNIDMLAIERWANSLVESSGSGVPGALAFQLFQPDSLAVSFSPVGGYSNLYVATISSPSSPDNEYQFSPVGADWLTYEQGSDNQLFWTIADPTTPQYENAAYSFVFTVTATTESYASGDYLWAAAQPPFESQTLGLGSNGALDLGSLPTFLQANLQYPSVSSVGCGEIPPAGEATYLTLTCYYQCSGTPTATAELFFSAVGSTAT